MPFIRSLNKDFKIENNQIVLTKDFFDKNINGFKKITGSRIGSILGFNLYTTPVKAWALMVKIYTETMDQTLAKVGCEIEPKIKAYVEQTLQQKYISYEPAKIGWDIFSEDKIFGGIPDGEPIDINGKLCYEQKAPMLEIKTTSIDAFEYKKINGTLRMQKDANDVPIIKEKNKKYNSWFDSNNQIIIPKDYSLQLGLYLYLRNIEKGIFAIGFLNVQDYVMPQKYDANDHIIKLVDFKINIKKFENLYIEQAKKWYSDFIKKGVSPQLTQKDIIWLKEEGII